MSLMPALYATSMHPSAVAPREAALRVWHEGDPPHPGRRPRLAAPGKGHRRQGEVLAAKVGNVLHAGPVAVGGRFWGCLLCNWVSQCTDCIPIVRLDHALNQYPTPNTRAHRPTTSHLIPTHEPSLRRPTRLLTPPAAPRTSPSPLSRCGRAHCSQACHAVLCCDMLVPPVQRTHAGAAGPLVQGALCFQCAAPLLATGLDPTCCSLYGALSNKHH